jgi:hypothetical protein
MIQLDDLYFRKAIKKINAGGIVFEMLVKRSLGRIMPRWKDNITNDVTEIGWESVDWTNLAQAVVNTVMNILLSLHAMNFLLDCQ